jgi:hypothetical protein
MKKSTLLIFGAIGAIVLAIVILYLYGAGVRDSAVEKQESVNASWGNVQSAYQRRADLIGNLVETVRAAAENERKSWLVLLKLELESNIMQIVWVISSTNKAKESKGLHLLMIFNPAIW